MTTVRGTFSETGQSAAIVGRRVAVKMNFAGTASVDIEEQMPDGDWIKITTAITADHRSEINSGVLSAYRLNCTAYTNDVEYVLATGADG